MVALVCNNHATLDNLLALFRPATRQSSGLAADTALSAPFISVGYDRSAYIAAGSEGSRAGSGLRLEAVLEDE